MEGISKLNYWGYSGIFLTAEMKEKKCWFEEDLIKKKRSQNLGDLGNSQLIHIVKNEKAFLFFLTFSFVLTFSLSVEENIVLLNNHLIKRSWVKLMYLAISAEARNRDYISRVTASLEIKGTEKAGQREGENGGIFFLKHLVLDHITIQLQTCAFFFFLRKGKMPPKHSEITQAATPILEPKRWVCLTESWRWKCPPLRVWRTEHRTRGL